MEEIIKIPVSIDEGEEDLSFSYSCDVISLRIGDKEICSFDFKNNLEPAIKRMLELWSNKED